jgi:hypothetical protein
VGPLKRTLIALHCKRVNRVIVAMAPLMYNWEKSAATVMFKKLHEIYDTYLTAIGFPPGDSGPYTCTKIEKKITTCLRIKYTKQ